MPPSLPLPRDPQVVRLLLEAGASPPQGSALVDAAVDAALDASSGAPSLQEDDILAPAGDKRPASVGPAIAVDGEPPSVDDEATSSQVSAATPAVGTGWDWDARLGLNLNCTALSLPADFGAESGFGRAVGAARHAGYGP